ncbi:MAG: hypothetical protein HYX48_07475 [Chlamydiales bacterium]|nr:hypothetical protein [Chlamydiales bacterium]
MTTRALNAVSGGLSSALTWVRPLSEKSDKAKEVYLFDRVSLFLDHHSMLKVAQVCTTWRTRDAVKDARSGILISKTPQDVQSQILSFVDFGSMPLSKRLAKYNKYLDQFVTPAHVTRLDEAHALTERLYPLNNISLLGKFSYQELKQRREDFFKRLVEIIAPIQEELRGARCFRELVDSGCYLKVLRVFFFHRPQVLLNYATDAARADGRKGTILHCAAGPKDLYISIPFVAFVLDMDRTHQLGLSRFCNVDRLTPLEYGRNNIRGTYGQRLENWKRAKALLVRHDAEVDAPFRAAQLAALPPPAPAIPAAPAAAAAAAAVVVDEAPEEEVAQPAAAEPTDIWSVFCRMVSDLFTWLMSWF